MTLAPTLSPITSNAWTDLVELRRTEFGVPFDLTPARTTSGDERDVLRDFHENGKRRDGITAVQNARIRDCWLKQNYIGVRFTSSDCTMSGTYCICNRDAGVLVMPSAGNIALALNHIYGAQISVLNLGGNEFRDAGSTIADCWVGGLCLGESTFSGSLFQFCENRSIVFRGGKSLALGCTINVPLELASSPKFSYDGQDYWGCGGFQFDGNKSRILASVITLVGETQGSNKASGNPSFGGIVNANDCTVDNVICDGSNFAGARAYSVYGERRNVKIHSDVPGFQQADALALWVEKASQLNVRLGIDGIGKTLDKYVKLPGGWGGSCVLVDTLAGHEVHLTPGVAIG